MTEFSLQMDVTDDRWKFINQATIGPKMLGFRLTRENPLSVTVKEWVSRFWFQKSLKEQDNSDEQTLITGGYLFGLFATQRDILNESNFSALVQGITDEETQSVLRPVVKDLTNIVTRTLKILKYKYNQYWIREIEYDTRSGNLGYYASLLGLSIRYKDDLIRLSLPSEATAFATMVADREVEKNVIVQSDLNQISEMLKDDHFEVTFLDRKISEAFVHFVQSEIDDALVCFGTVVDLYVEQYLKTLLLENYNNERVYNKLRANLERRDQLIVILGSKGVPATAVEEAVDCLNKRNEIIHEGHTFNTKTSIRFAVLRSLKVLSSVFDISRRRFPLHNIG